MEWTAHPSTPLQDALQRTTINVDDTDLRAYRVASPKRENVTQVAVFLLHGAGQTSFSFLPLLYHLFPALDGQFADQIQWTFYLFDFRGHGASGGEVTDLSIGRLCADALLVVQSVLPWDDGRQTKVVLGGHSMGGAVAIQLAASLNDPVVRSDLNLASFLHEVATDGLEESSGQATGAARGPLWIRHGTSRAVFGGIIVMDIVEGTAVDAIDRSKAILEDRPTSFSSTGEAVQWALGANILNNIQSAQLTVPSQLVQRADGTFGWRTNVLDCAEKWLGWYHDLSKRFLAIPCTGKLLVLAGTDRLDTALTVAQMQGKFRLVVFPQVRVGHFVHEDAPAVTARAVSGFLSHNFVGSKVVGRGMSAEEILKLKRALS